MNKRKIFSWMSVLVVIVSTVFMVKTALAIEEGQNLTQTDIDRINPETIDRVFLQCQKENEFKRDPSFVYSCLEIEQKGQSSYQVIRVTDEISFTSTVIKLALMTRNVQQLQELIPLIINRDVEKHVQEIKEDIASYKTNENVNLIRRFLINFNPFR